MTKTYFKIFVNFILIGLFLAGCTPMAKKGTKGFKHDTPLIKTDIKKLGKMEVDKSVDMGPIPVEADVVKLKKRKKISSVKEKNYLLIPDEYQKLKQNLIK